MSSLVCASLALLVTVFQQAPASARPDFSGTWTLDRSRSQSPEAITLTIKQTATEVSIETTRDGTKSVRTYPIEPEGKPSSGIDSSHPRAYWNGTKLVAEGAGNIQGQTVSTRETHSLNAAATEMTVESIIIVQHGYSFGGSRNYGSAKDVYMRVKS